MTYYDKINNLLTQFLFLDISKIVTSYVFIYNNKYIADLNEKQIYEFPITASIKSTTHQFPAEFQTTSFDNKFVLCESIEHKNLINQNLDTDFYRCIECKIEIFRGNEPHTGTINKYAYDIDDDFVHFLDETKGEYGDWCVFLQYFSNEISMYWYININKFSNLYGNVLCWLCPNWLNINDKVYMCKNIIEFENIFYQSLDKTYIQDDRDYNFEELMYFRTYDDISRKI